MSTRRARIKAVTSLPPRRKNAETGDTAKKQEQASDNADKALRSPRTPRSASKAFESTERKSPAGWIGSPLKSPRNVTRTPNFFKTSSPLKIHSVEIQKGRQTPKIAEKVAVITSTAAFKQNVFISPQSPATRTSASPVAKTLRRTPVDNVPKVLTACKGRETPGKVIQQSVKSNINQNEVIKSKGESNSSITNKETRSEAPDADYNVPSVPESLTEDTVMDGIIPLQAAGSVPNPIALLKNEIISENAEVFFDPIVPLPSPSKIRPKLRPAPRLPPRRNSIQGSASESEDESRRALHSIGSGTPAAARQRHDSQTSHVTLQSAPNREVNRIRNDSVCSTMSLAAHHAAATSPVKEKHYSKNRRQDHARRSAAMRRRTEVVKRDTLTMYDLIFYNPTTKPFVKDQDELEAKEANEKEAETAHEEEVDDPSTSSAAPVPQVKIGPNGEIILDEKSLVINRSDSRKVTSVVREGAWGGGARYRRAARTAEWSDAETVRFYRALAALGTDFTLMEPLFPGRKRKDLKLKFKKEEKINGGQVDKALRTGAQWDATRLQQEFEDERSQAAEREARREARGRHQRRTSELRKRNARAHALRTSKGTKALDYTSAPSSDHHTTDEGTADSLIQKMYELTDKRKSSRPWETNPSKPLPVGYPEFATLTPKKLIPEFPRVEQVKPLNMELVPANIESGSLVVLSVNDPNSPAKKMLQTYIAHEAGRLTPVALPSSLLSSVVGYMKKGAQSSGSSPQLISPNSVASHESRNGRGSTPNAVLHSSPTKRLRRSSFTLSQL